MSTTQTSHNRLLHSGGQAGLGKDLGRLLQRHNVLLRLGHQQCRLLQKGTGAGSVGDEEVKAGLMVRSMAVVLPIRCQIRATLLPIRDKALRVYRAVQQQKGDNHLNAVHEKPPGELSYFGGKRFLGEKQFLAYLDHPPST